jgi:hypothetical protein
MLLRRFGNREFSLPERRVLSGQLLMDRPAELEKQAVEAEDKSNEKASN